MKILHRHDDGSFKAVIRVFDHEGIVGAPLFQKADYEPQWEQIQKRSDHGVLCGEMGHPHIGEGFSDEYRLQRYMCVHEDMVCCSFSDVKFERVLDFGDATSTVPEGVEPKAYEVITAVVKPTGRFKDVFQDVLQFPEKYEFSTRAITKGWRVDGPRMDVFVTWDLVPASNLARVIRLKDLQLS